MPWRTPPVLHFDRLVEPFEGVPTTILNGAELGPDVAACPLTLPDIGESSDAAATEQVHNKKDFDCLTAAWPTTKGTLCRRSYLG